MLGEEYNYGKKYLQNQWTENMPHLKSKHHKGYEKGRVRPAMIIDMEIRVGNSKIYRSKGMKKKDVERTLETLMSKYGCECECK